MTVDLEPTPKEHTRRNHITFSFTKTISTIATIVALLVVFSSVVAAISITSSKTTSNTEKIAAVEQKCDVRNEKRGEELSGIKENMATVIANQKIVLSQLSRVQDILLSKK